MIAGLAGALYAYNFSSVSADRFDPFTALSLIAFAYAGGITLISGAVFAGLISTQALFPYALDKWFGINGNWFLLFGGAILIITLIQNPEGVAGAFYKRTHKRSAVHPPERTPSRCQGSRCARRPWGRAGPCRASQPPGRADAAAATRPCSQVHGPVGRVRRRARAQRRRPRGPRRRIGRADRAERRRQDDADRRGHRVRPLHREGRARRGGHQLRCRPTGEPAAGWRGRGRTPICSTTSRLARTLLWRPPGQSSEKLANTRTAPRLTRHRSWSLSTSTGRWTRCPMSCPRGRASSSGSRVPWPGILVSCAWTSRPPGSTRERARSSVARLRSLADRGQTTLLIDHDMGLVLGICDRVVVLEFGRVIADGPPDVVRQDARVIAAYLGGAAAADAPAPVETPTGGSHEST